MIPFLPCKRYHLHITFKIYKGSEFAVKFNPKSLTTQVIAAIVLGIAFGAIFPAYGTELKVLADIFIKMVKMIIAPIVFLTIVIGIAGMGDLKKVGKIGGKALLYFEIVSTIALAIGILIANVFKAGEGFDASHAAKGDISTYTKQAASTSHGFMDFVLTIIPDSFIGAFAKGELLPVLFIAVLFGCSLAAMGKGGRPVIDFFEKITQVLFGIVNIIMKVSPIAAFGAMSYTIGKFGFGSLIYLGKLMGSVYTTMALFIIIVLGIICKLYGFSIFKFIRYIKEEILLVVGTSSSEAALPPMMDKLEKYGCSKSVVGLVLPTGYSFNLDGTSIYLSMAALFIAQAYGVDLSLMEQLTLLGVLMLTSKGAAGVTGSGFVTLAATLAVFPSIPVEGMALILGVDRFMSEARAVTNLIGNGVATVVVSKMEGEFTPQAAEVLSTSKKQVSA